MIIFGGYSWADKPWAAEKGLNQRLSSCLKFDHRADQKYPAELLTHGFVSFVERWLNGWNSVQPPVPVALIPVGNFQYFTLKDQGACSGQFLTVLDLGVFSKGQRNVVTIEWLYTELNATGCDRTQLWYVVLSSHDPIPACWSASLRNELRWSFPRPTHYVWGPFPIKRFKPPDSSKIRPKKC